MKRVFKAMLLAGGTALAGYFAYSQYRSFNNAVQMDKSLHTFLKNLYGEEPDLQTVKALRKIKVRAGFSADTCAKYQDIDSSIIDYVREYYPALASGLSVEVFAKTDTE